MTKESTADRPVAETKFGSYTSPTGTHLELRVNRIGMISLATVTSADGSSTKVYTPFNTLREQ